jgi:hypothetical protein
MGVPSWDGPALTVISPDVATLSTDMTGRITSQG